MTIRKEIDLKAPLTDFQRQMLDVLKDRPVQPDVDCPELTAEQLAQMIPNCCNREKSVNKSMSFKVSYYDKSCDDFLGYKTFDTLAAAQTEVSRLISPPDPEDNSIAWNIDWQDEDGREHEIRYVLTLDGWDMYQER